MKSILFCNKGIEDIASAGLSNVKLGGGYATFEVGSHEELCKIAYTNQAISKVGLLLGKSKDISSIGKIDFSSWIDKDHTFKVDGNVDGGVKGNIGDEIIDNLEDDVKVDLENPDIIVYVYLDNEYYVCIDFSGRDLSKRSYRIFSSPRNIKSTIAYAMVKLSGYGGKEVLVDPLCLSGSVVIEAALLANNFPVNFHDKDFAFMKFIDFDFDTVDKLKKDKEGNILGLDGQFKNLSAAKKNAKIAGIQKSIGFSRKELNWLDTKFEEGEVERIVTCLPILSKYSNKSEVLKIYKEFFYQAEFVLSKEGSIVVCCRNPNEVKDECREFKQVLEREVWQGQENFFLLKFEKD